jgi:hypothetical protein
MLIQTCPKHVDFYSKNKFEELVNLVGFIIRKYRDARSSVKLVSTVGDGEHFKGPPDFINATELFNSVLTSKLHTMHHVRS